MKYNAMINGIYDNRDNNSERYERYFTDIKI